MTVIQHIESKLGYRVLAQCTRGPGLKSLIENQVLVTLPQNHIAPCMSTPNSLMPHWFLMGISNIGMLIILIKSCITLHIYMPYSLVVSECFQLLKQFVNIMYMYKRSVALSKGCYYKVLKYMNCSKLNKIRFSHFVALMRIIKIP